MGEEPRGNSGHIGLRTALNLGKVRNVRVVGVKGSDELLEGSLANSVDVVQINARKERRGLSDLKVDRPARVKL